MGKLRIITVLITLAALGAAGVLAVPASGKSTPTCRTGQLKLSVATIEPALSHGGWVVRFQNQGARCSLRGYLSIISVGAQHQRVAVAHDHLSGYLVHVSHVETVVLGHGQVGSTAIEGVATATAHCLTATQLVVSLPGDTKPVYLNVKATNAPYDCRLWNHPVVPGPTGNLPAKAITLP